MGVVSACAFSFMSKYLHQSCSPKPMTRVDINENNQSSNRIHMEILDPRYYGIHMGEKTNFIQTRSQMVGQNLFHLSY
jgi:hypothetical protein